MVDGLKVAECIERDVKFALDIQRAQAHRLGRPLRGAEGRWVVAAAFRYHKKIGRLEADEMADSVLKLIEAAKGIL